MPAFGKRIDGVHGRRDNTRDPALVPVVFTTLLQSGPVAMTNLSRTGAKLTDCAFVRVGDEAMVQVAGMMVMGTIMWADGESCGLRFDEPLSDAALARAQDRSVLIPRSPMSPEEQLAMNEWATGWGG